MNNNLKTVHICNHHGEFVETVDLRINRNTFHPGVQFQAIRNKLSMPRIKLEFIAHDTDGSIIAKKLK